VEGLRTFDPVLKHWLFAAAFQRGILSGWGQQVCPD